MGNCCERCFGKFDKRRYLRTRYNVERDMSIEFENLMDEESKDENSRNATSSYITEKEKVLLRNRQYEDIVRDQLFIDDALTRELVQQEDELRREEEAYYHSKGETDRASRFLLSKDGDNHRNKSSVPYRKTRSSWLGEDDGNWDIAGNEEDEDDDDFDTFLECVRAKSATAQNHINNLLVPDVASDGDQSKTEASSIDLEWEHEAGMQPLQNGAKKNHYSTSNDDETKPSIQTDKLSSDFEWDNDFASGTSQLCNSKIDTINNNNVTDCIVNASVESTATPVSVENLPPR